MWSDSEISLVYLVDAALLFCLNIVFSGTLAST
jgi:hypothetical protein